MKTTIKSAIIFSAFALLSTGVLAANQVKTDTLTNEVTATVSYYDNTCGVDVSIAKATEGDSIVIIYDAAGKVVLTDSFAVETDTVQKSYLLTGLADGDYTIAVTAGGEVVKHTLQLDSQADAETTFAF